MHNIFSEYARLLRLPGLGGLSIAPVFGALSLINTGYNISFQDIALLFLIGAFTAIYGFVLNDYMDVKIDKLSKELSNRPLVKGTISKKTALVICIISFIGVFIIIFLFFYKNQISFYIGLACILLSAFFATLYNIYGKKIIGSDFIVALSEALLVLFGAFIVTQDVALSIFTWIVFLLTFNQLVYMNAVEGGLKDADHDYLLNVKNIALAAGVKVIKNNQFVIPPVFKAFGMGVRLFSASLVFVPFVFFNEPFEIWHILLLILFVIGVLYLSEKLLTMKTFNRNKIRKLITAQTFLRYSLVPIMLVPILGVASSTILIIFPFIWYIVFALLIGEKLFRPGL